MIQKLTKAKNIGILNSPLIVEDDLEFTRFSIIYGYNGSGKTTFSNFLRLFTEDWPFEVRESILNKMKSDLSKEVEFEIIWDGGKVKTLPKKGKKLYVFNSTFVNDHVYDGSSSKMRGFSGNVVTKDQLKDAEIKKVEDEIGVIEEDLQLSKEVFNKYERKAESIREELSKLWNENIEKFRLPPNLKLDNPEVPRKASDKSTNDLLEELEDHFRRFKLSSGNQELALDISTLENQRFSLNMIPEDVKELLNKDIGGNAFSKVKEKITEYKEAELNHYSPQQWFEDGTRMLEVAKSNHCPLCDSEINTEDIVEKYRTFFSEEVSSFQKLLSGAVEACDDLKQDLNLCRQGLTLLDSLGRKYGYRSRWTSEQLHIAKLAREEIKNVSSECKTISSLLKSKQANFSFGISAEEGHQLEETLVNIKDLKEYLTKVDEIRKEFIDYLKESNFESGIARAAAKSLFWKRFDTDGLKKAEIDRHGGRLLRYWRNNKKIEELNKKVQMLRGELSRLLAKLKQESRFINFYLSRLAIDHFTINLNEKNESENIQVVYKQGLTKEGIEYSLSEGEKLP